VRSRHGLDAAGRRPPLAWPVVHAGLAVLTIPASSGAAVSEISPVSDPLQQFESSEQLWIGRNRQVTAVVTASRRNRGLRSSRDFRVSGGLSSPEVIHDLLCRGRPQSRRILPLLESIEGRNGSCL
jgi:hypothetical protein